MTAAPQVPPSLDFGFAASKEECKRSFTFTNVGEVAVDYEWKIDEPFTFTPNAGRLSPGESQNVHSVFLPPDASVFVANVRSRKPLRRRAP